MNYLIIIFLFPIYLVAQESFVGAGEINSSANGSVSFSMGIVCDNQISNNEHTIEEGIQQSYFVTPIDIETNDRNNNISIHPNPTSGKIYVTIENLNKLTDYKIINNQGEVIKENTIKNKITEIKLIDISDGIYFILLLSNDTLTKTYKIIKQ
jgi:hypothetical protein